MNQVKNTNNYTYDPENIAESLKKAMSQNADVSVVKYLNNARKEKIASGGAGTAMYKNDALTKAADEYEKRFEKPDVSKLYEARRANLAEGLKNAHSAAKKAYDASVAAAGDDYSEARRLYVADEYKKGLNVEAGLARVGLGRGNANAATSGVGESARVKMLADSGEGLRKLYKDEADTKQELSNQLSKQYNDAYEKYSDALDKTYADQVQDSLDTDKNYQSNRLENLKLNDTRQESDRDFEFEKSKTFSENEYNKAYKAFEATGVITSEAQAEILGIPKGSESLDMAKVKREIATEERKLELDEKKLVFDQALELFSETGEVTSEEQADVLGLKVGDTTLDAEKLAFDITYSQKKLDNEETATAFENAYSLFEAVGSVTTQAQADVLGIPVGTKYWKYVTDSVRANAAAQNASSNSVKAGAAAQNANTNTYKSETDRLELKAKAESDLRKSIQDKNKTKE